jgi:uncharacterized phiE125 gp8 family phage protein
MGLRQTVPPDAEPIEEDEANAFLKIDDDVAESDLVESLIVSARETAERLTGRQLIQATWLLTLESFFDPAWCYWHCRYGWCIRVPRPPLINVVELTYIDTAGDEQTLVEDTDFQVDGESEPALICPTYGRIWPTPRVQPNAVSVTFRAGYGTDSEDIPQGIKTAMKMMMSEWYWGSPEQAKNFMAISDVPPAVENLLRGYWHGSLA